MNETPFPPALQALAARGTSIQLAAGERLISDGELGDSLYLVVEGRLRVFASSVADGRELLYGHCEAGDYVGEMSLDGGPRTASVAAEIPTRCVRIDREALLAHLREHPEFALEMLTKVLRRVRQTTASLKALARNLN